MIILNSSHGYEGQVAGYKNCAYPSSELISTIAFYRVIDKYSNLVRCFRVSQCNFNILVRLAGTEMLSVNLKHVDVLYAACLCAHFFCGGQSSTVKPQATRL